MKQIVYALKDKSSGKFIMDSRTFSTKSAASNAFYAAYRKRLVDQAHIERVEVRLKEVTYGE